MKVPGELYLIIYRREVSIKIPGGQETEVIKHEPGIYEVAKYPTRLVQ